MKPSFDQPSFAMTYNFDQGGQKPSINVNDDELDEILKSAEKPEPNFENRLNNLSQIGAALYDFLLAKIEDNKLLPDDKKEEIKKGLSEKHLLKEYLDV